MCRCVALASLGALGITACGDDVTMPVKTPGIPLATPASKPVGDLAVCCAADTLLTGDVVRLGARVTSTDGQLLSGRSIDWVSSDPTVVSVSPFLTDAAVVTAGQAGSATVSATIEGKSAVLAFRVLPLHPAVAFAWSTSQGMRDLTGLPDALNSYATGVNASGRIVGYSEFADGTRAVVWPDGSTAFELQRPAGFQSTRATAINASGIVVGWGTMSDGRTRAIRWLPGGEAELLALAGSDNSSRANAINSAGVVVGRSGDTPVVWSATAVSRLPVAGRLGSKAEAISINDRGDVVGTASSSEYEIGGAALFWPKEGDVRELPAPCDEYFAEDCIQTFAGAINNAGFVAGSVDGGVFVWSSASISTVYLNPSNVYIYGTRSTGINATGQIVGYAHTTEVRIRSFLSPLGTAVLPVTSATAHAAVVALGINDAGLVVGWHR